MDRIRRDTLLGIVFFGTLAFLLWATVNLTDISLGKVPPLTVFFADGGGADVGTNVLVLGKKVGKVITVDNDYERPDQRVKMVLGLKEPVPLTDQALIEVRDSGVLGGKIVYIDPGRGARLTKFDDLRGLSQPSAFERLGGVADGEGQLGQSVVKAVNSFGAFFDNMNNEESTMGRIVTRRELYDELLQGVRRLNGIFEAIQEGRGLVGSLVMNTDMRDRATRLIANLEKLSETLTGTEGTVPMLLNDRGTAENVRQTIADIAKMIADTRAGEGALGRILRDRQLADDLTAALSNMRQVLQKANDPEAGAIGALLADSATGKAIREAVGYFRDLGAALNRADGPLGILINDKEMGVRLRRIFTQVSRAIEDAREAAPIGNLVQVLLGMT